MDHPPEPIAKLDRATRAALTSGADMWSTVAVPAAGIPWVKMADGPMGIASGRVDERDVATLAPCGAALGATFDRDMVLQVATVLGNDARRMGVQLVLAPNLNLPRSPLVGRAFEMFSEDAHVAGELGAAFVAGLDRGGVGAVAKHLVCNDSETRRDTMSAVVDERALREIYLAPFERVARAGCAGILAAYNRLNGTYCVEHRRLLTDIVKTEWRFPGFIVSDWFGGRDTRACAEAGLDLDMPGPDRSFGAKLAACVERGDVSEARLTDAAQRVADAARSYDPARGAPLAAPDRAETLQAAAAGGFVMLRNEGSLLPLAPRAGGSLAVIGPNAVAPCFQGGTFAKVALRPDAMLPLDALRARFGPIETVVYEPGVDPEPRLPPLPVTPARDLGDGCTRGMTVEFFAGHDGEGVPVFAETRDTNSLTWFSALPGVGAMDQPGLIRASGIFTPMQTGSHRFHIGGTGAVRLAIDGTNVFRRDQGVAAADLMGVLKAGESDSVDVILHAGTPVCVVAELRTMPARAQGLWYGVRRPGGGEAEMLARAVAAARAADRVVLIVGETADAGVESRDRPDTALPAAQVRLIDQVCAVNANVVAVVNVGHAFDATAAAGARALLLVWYPGEEFGPALAQVLAGDREPGGRLPVTLAQAEADYPALDTTPDAKLDLPYRERHLVGYRHFAARGVAPLYSFGAGQGYASFRWSAGTFANGVARVSLTNMSDRKGKAVVQVYVQGPDPADEPATLRGFTAVDLAPGQTVEAQVELDERAFAHWSTERNGWAVTPGTHLVRIGASATDIRYDISVTPDATP